MIDSKIQVVFQAKLLEREDLLPVFVIYGHEGHSLGRFELIRKLTDNKKNSLIILWASFYSSTLVFFTISTWEHDNSDDTEGELVGDVTSRLFVTVQFIRFISSYSVFLCRWNCDSE